MANRAAIFRAIPSTFIPSGDRFAAIMKSHVIDKENVTLQESKHCKLKK